MEDFIIKDNVKISKYVVDGVNEILEKQYDATALFTELESFVKSIEKPIQIGMSYLEPDTHNTEKAIYSVNKFLQYYSDREYAGAITVKQIWIHTEFDTVIPIAEQVNSWEYIMENLCDKNVTAPELYDITIDFVNMVESLFNAKTKQK